MSRNRFRIAIAVAAVSVLSVPTLAIGAPVDVLRDYESAAREASPGFSASAARGAQFFQSTHGGAWSCASCHTPKPVVTGQHAKTGKAIAPLAPAANPERFTDRARIEKWFKRNCNDVLSRACTPQEKGDVLAFLLSLE